MVGRLPADRLVKGFMRVWYILYISVQVVYKWWTDSKRAVMSILKVGFFFFRLKMNEEEEVSFPGFHS